MAKANFLPETLKGSLSGIKPASTPVLSNHFDQYAKHTDGTMLCEFGMLTFHFKMVAKFPIPDSEATESSFSYSKLTKVQLYQHSAQQNGFITR